MGEEALKIAYDALAGYRPVLQGRAASSSATDTR